jgi:hypothetical protein
MYSVYTEAGVEGCRGTAARGTATERLWSSLSRIRHKSMGGRDWERPTADVVIGRSSPAARNDDRRRRLVAGSLTMDPQRCTCPKDRNLTSVIRVSSPLSGCCSSHPIVVLRFTSSRQTSIERLGWPGENATEGGACASPGSEHIVKSKLP